MPSNRLAHFLIVEDNDAHAELLQRSLERHRIGNTFTRVADGEAALRYVRREGEYSSSPRPDAVILDLKMPKVSGHEVIASMKADPALRAIPVVVLTTSASEIDKAKALAKNANSYVVKPIEFEAFNQMVRDLGLFWGVWNARSAEPCTAGLAQSDAAR